MFIIIASIAALLLIASIAAVIGFFTTEPKKTMAQKHQDHVRREINLWQSNQGYRHRREQSSTEPIFDWKDVRYCRKLS